MNGFLKAEAINSRRSLKMLSEQIHRVICLDTSFDGLGEIAAQTERRVVFRGE